MGFHPDSPEIAAGVVSSKACCTQELPGASVCVACDADTGCCLGCRQQAFSALQYASRTGEEL